LSYAYSTYIFRYKYGSWKRVYVDKRDVGIREEVIKKFAKRT